MIWGQTLFSAISFMIQNALQAQRIFTKHCTYITDLAINVKIWGTHEYIVWGFEND